MTLNVLVTGGCGYKGSVLIPKLLSKGYKVKVLDTMWFNNYLDNHSNLSVENFDIRNIEKYDLNGFDSVIHLSSVANDPCSDLNPKLTWEISALSTLLLAERAYKSNVKHFIYASSGSVYGIKDELQVTEDLSLNPISEYNKTKMVAEKILESYSSKFLVQIVRPATVCGVSKRMRFDVSVNALTISALENNFINVDGGSQVRPNIHIDDITDLYLFLLERKDIEGIYNAGFENLSILEIAEKVKKITNAEIKVNKTLDPRNYRMNSDKLLSKGFIPKKNVNDAILEICKSFKQKLLKNEDHFNNLKWMMKNKYE